MVSRARADHRRPAPLPNLKGVGRPNQQLRLRRTSTPALLYPSKDSPSSRGRAISSSVGIDGKWYTSR
eukprot:7156745-Pyramimonas_sp.AAC.1